MLIAVMACRNRAQLTVAAASAVAAAADELGVPVEVIVADDGSSDGTADALETISNVTVIPGSGDLYWGGGMRAAIEEAIRRRPEYLLWLNDDVQLFDDAISTAVRSLNQAKETTGAPCIVVGATRSRSGRTTYSGMLRARGRFRLRLRRAEPVGALVEIDTMNGNFVLIDADTLGRVGNIDKAFRHTLGDLDYGLRARRHGCFLFLLPQYVGICERNSPQGSHRDASLSRWQRLRSISGIKSMPPIPTFRYLKRHGGLAWPLQWVWIYLRPLTQRLPLDGADND